MVSPVHGDYRRCQAEIPLIGLFKFAEPALKPIRTTRKIQMAWIDSRAQSVDKVPAEKVLKQNFGTALIEEKL